MTLGALLSGVNPVVRVQLSEVRGSSPREAGAEMFVTTGATWGTIGGGRLEFMALEAARNLWASGKRAAELDVPLGPEIGQCCGGRVVVTLTLLDTDERAAALAQAKREHDARPVIHLFGSGHVGRALANLLQHLPFQTVLVDERQAELDLCSASVENRLAALPEAEIGAAEDGSVFIVATHDHGLDFLLTAAALRRGDAAYVGLIGSATKRAKFETWCSAQEEAVRLDSLVCPIGASEGRDKRPEVIAAFVVAEVVAAISR